MASIGRYLILFLFLSGCSRLFDDTVVYRFSPIIIPEDQATEEERLLLSSTVRLIEDYASELGHNVKFDSVPIVIRVRENPAENIAGRCHYKYDLTGSHIEIFKDVVPISLARRENSFAPELFIVLLHEIGHCYFQRSHQNDLIKKSGYEMIFELRDSDIVFSEVPSSVMIEAWNMGLPKSLERYYVGEVLGLYRATTPEELKNYVSFYLRPTDFAGALTEIKIKRGLKTPVYTE